MARRMRSLDPTPASRPRRRRCAIYTRKSSEEGLEQSFNSLHAQRDACAAYIASQKHEGWTLDGESYDDGGLSGGTMERPALQRLLDDVRAGRIDIVVVYKVDRLTRSLADFAKLTELFDAHGTSFVSVTQQFNTSTSMGRLTLNVLLSFAQFEREVAGERIRDKIAASKRRGMWMGGLPPLGYDGVERRLVVNEAEAETVRRIFRRFLELGSIRSLKAWLDAEGIVSKRRRFADGREAGGRPVSRGALYQILRNRLYRGEIAHRGEVHRGEHEPIVDPELWDAVQARLMEQGQRLRQSGPSADAPEPSRQPPLLAGIAFDASGDRLTPTHATKRGRRYRYYVSAALSRGGPNPDGVRVPAPDLEELVRSTVAERLRDAVWLSSHLPAGALVADQTERLLAAARSLGSRIRSYGIFERDHEPADLRRLLERVTVGKGRISIELNRGALVEALMSIDPALPFPPVTGDGITIEVAAQALRCGKDVRLVIGTVGDRPRDPDERLVRLVADARRWFDELATGRRRTIAEIAVIERREVSLVSRTISLAVLAPGIVAMILEGRQPAALTPERLKAACPLPLLWHEQSALLLD